MGARVGGAGARAIRAAVGAATGVSDHDLLARFAGGDESAFATLVARHTGMVLGVCRRTLPTTADAEDACQATFLVLARRAKGGPWQLSVANWLYTTARRIAARARRTAERRGRRERRAAPPAQASILDQMTGREAFAVLDEELERLPPRYREPLVLCHLEGLTRDEAAARLGVPPATLKSQLDRGRKKLGEALSRRGVGLGAGLLAATATSPAGASPPGLQRAVLAAATGNAPPPVAALAREVAVTGLLKKSALLVLTLVGAAAVGLGFPPHEPRAAGQPPPRSAPAGPGAGRVAEPDTDSDGLPDFHEVRKYRTDPTKKDTAGTGVADGDWGQRRAFTYSVRAVIRVMPPYDLKTLTDDYQDVRVRRETKEFAELEVVVYPFNSNAEAVRGNPNWKADYAGMRAYLAPGVTTNWDEPMRRDLLRELAAAGIDPDQLTDQEVVERVSRWLFNRSRHRSMFCTFYVGFRAGRPEVLPGLGRAFERDRGDPGWTVQQQFEHELFGKEMFAHKTYGTCTSAAVYQTTILRALGIPTRMILCVPPADASDPSQVDLLEKGLTNHRVRQDTILGVAAGGSSFTSHTFCEVFVGGRWRRLDATTLGRNVLERNYLGLMIKVHTFNDLSEANLAETWGTRYALGRRDDEFKHSNPYRLLEVSDRFGESGAVPNPPAANELKRVTIDRVYWPESRSAPAEIQGLKWGKEPGSGQFFVHGREWLDDAGGYLQYKLFMRRADRTFTLRAAGRPDVSCRLSMNFYTDRPRSLCELEVVIPPAEYARMARGVAYTLHPTNDRVGYEWAVRDGLTLTRE